MEAFNFNFFFDIIFNYDIMTLSMQFFFITFRNSTIKYDSC